MKPEVELLLPASETAAQALAAVHDELIALRADELVPVTANIAFAVGIVLEHADNVLELLVGMAPAHQLKLPHAFAVRTYAAACLHAHRVATERPPDRLPELVAEGRALRDGLFEAAKLLTRFDVFSAEDVAKIRRSNSYAGIATDLGVATALFFANWERVAARTPFSRETVERALAISCAITMAIAQREAELVRQKTDGDADDICTRAFTLLVRSWNQCRRAVA